MNRQFANTKLFDQFVLQWLACFCAQSLDAFFRIVSGQSGEIHASDRAQEPGDLPIFFDGTSRDESGGAAFNGTGVYAYGLDPVEVERGAAVDLKRAAGQNGDGLRVRARICGALS